MAFTPDEERIWARAIRACGEPAERLYAQAKEALVTRSLVDTQRYDAGMAMLLRSYGDRRPAFRWSSALEELRWRLHLASASTVAALLGDPDPADRRRSPEPVERDDDNRLVCGLVEQRAQALRLLHALAPGGMVKVQDIPRVRAIIEFLRG